jgi:FlaA1/EpsC-like NDP-sugar epimerase
VELGVDVAALSACWLGAYALRFDGDDLAFYLRASAVPALPFVIGAKILVLLLFDLYRGFWRTIRFADVGAIARAVALGSVVVVVVATITQRFENYSRGVIVIDGLLSLLACGVPRDDERVPHIERLRQERGPAAHGPIVSPRTESRSSSGTSRQSRRQSRVLTW